jgi:hypothetical protein
MVLLNRIAELHLLLNAFIVPRNWYTSMWSTGHKLVLKFYALQSQARNLLKEAKLCTTTNSTATKWHRCHHQLLQTPTVTCNTFYGYKCGI